MVKFTGEVVIEHMGHLAFKPDNAPQERIFARVNGLTDPQKIALHGKIGQRCSFNFDFVAGRIMKINGDIEIL